MTLAVSHGPPTAEAWVRSLVCQGGIYGGQSGQIIVLALWMEEKVCRYRK
jgi:hypothetical protein